MPLMMNANCLKHALCKSRILTVFALIFCVCFIIPSCHPNRLPPTHSSAIFTIAMDESPKNIHPHFAFDLNSQLIDEMLFESLTVLADDTLPTCTRLCQSWTFKTPTLLVIKLSEPFLKGNLKFSDGTTITVKDVLASIEIMKHEKNPFKGAFDIIHSTSFVTPDELHIQLNAPKPSLPIDLYLVKILKSSQAIFPQVSPQDLIFSGPYTLSQADPASISLSVNPYYGQPAVGEPQNYKPLRLLFIRDEQTRIFKFMHHEVHAIFNSVPLRSAAGLAKDKNVTLLTTPGFNISYLGINHLDPLLKDPMIRRYIYESINIDELIRYKLHGFGIAHFSLLPMGSPFIHNSVGTKLTPQQQKMTKTKLKGKILTLKTSNQPQVMSLARVIQSQLASQGIILKHQPLEFGALMDDLNAGNFQLTYGKFVGITDPVVYYDFLHSNFFPPHGRNRGRFKHAVWDKLSETLSRETDPQKRKQLSTQLQDIFAQELPLIPLWVTQNIVALDAKHTLPKLSFRQSLRDFMYLQTPHNGPHAVK